HSTQEIPSFPTRRSSDLKKENHGHRSSRIQNARPASTAFARDGGQAERKNRGAEMDPHLGAHRPVDEGKEEAERQCRLLFCHRLDRKSTRLNSSHDQISY